MPKLDLSILTREDLCHFIEGDEAEIARMRLEAVALHGKIRDMRDLLVHARLRFAATPESSTQNAALISEIDDLIEE